MAVQSRRRSARAALTSHGGAGAKASRTGSVIATIFDFAMSLPAALAPLNGPVFRRLWLAWLAANMTMWMNDVAAAWLMTTLTTRPVMVALVQTASTLPVFLLGLPSGAIADIVDRRRYFAPRSSGSRSSR